MTTTRYTYFNGLNTLRFLAAFLVLIMHTSVTFTNKGLAIFPDMPIFKKGGAAVSFFFVLSGFLITYILLKELDLKNTISVKNFYLKRIFRIWPLYFIIVIFGFTFYWFILPKLGIVFKINYNKKIAVILYLFFAANLMSSLYIVGGILNVLWSIAVEEQFYLFWAPLLKKFKNNLLMVFITVFVFSFLIHSMNKYNLFNLTKGWQMFINKLQFHFMAIGAIFSYFTFKNPKKLLNCIFFKNKIVQLLLFIILLSYLFLYPYNTRYSLIASLISSLLFGWIIINVSINDNKIFKINNFIFDKLGEISYGIYMYHTIIIYLVSFIISKYKTILINFNKPVFILICVTILTILVSLFSFYFIENKILKVGRKKILQYN